MSPERIAELRALAEKATPGPRHARLAYKNEPTRGSLIAATAPGHQVWAEHSGGTFPGADMDFTAACDPQTVLALLDSAAREARLVALLERAHIVLGLFPHADECTCRLDDGGSCPCRNVIAVEQAIEAELGAKP